jgi:Concanavalin A-like lectin/glucanases superfamily/Fibronectin type III domain/Calcineurin-like phosphoesterase
MKVYFQHRCGIVLCLAIFFLSAFNKTKAQALQFDGTNDYVTFGQATTTLGTTNFTLESWVKRAAGGVLMSTGTNGLDGAGGRPTAYPIIAKGRGEGETPSNINTNYFLGITSTGFIGADFEDNAGGVNHPVWGVTVVPVGEWHHIAATYNGQTWNLYLDGILDRTLTLASPFVPENTSTQHAALATGLGTSGVPVGGSSGFLSGTVDEARIWNVARTPAEILANMNLELTSGTGLLGRWGLNDGAGTTAVNSIGGSPDGTLSGTIPVPILPIWVAGAPALDVPPAAPTGLSTTTISAFQINLAWTDNSTNETNFQIERSTTGIGGTYTLLATVSANTTSYNDISVNNGSTEYCYRVRAINGSGNSAYAGPTCATTPAEGANALDLGSAGAYVTFGVAPSLATQNFTIETWFKKTGAGIANTTGASGINIIPILSKGSPEAEGSTVDANYILGIQSGTNFIAADFEEGTGSSTPGLNHPIVGTTPITDNVWHHAAATFENGVFKIYLDGILEATLNLTPAIYPQGASIQHAALGTMITSTGTAAGKFHGVIDEARIWNFEKSESQIQAAINSQITTAQAGLLARWGLNEGSGTLIHGNAGTTVNGAVTLTGYSWVTPGAPFNLSFIPPIAPTGLVVSPTSSTAIQLTWTDNATDETGFEIERSTTGAGGPFTLLATVAANTITYNNTGLIASTNYCYRVKAKKSGLSSAYTTIECASTMSTGPTVLNLQDGVNSYTGTRDTYTYNVSPATVRGSEVTFIQDIDLAPDERRSLLLFDLSSIPVGSTIQSAELQFYVNTEGQGFNMHRMLVPWDEGTVTFASIGNRHFLANNTDAETAVNANWPGVDTYVGLITVPVPASTIQDWINGTLTNNGWLMIATHADDGQQLRSREHTTVADRPKLSVTYSISPPNQPINPIPVNNGTATSSNPNICATVSDPDGGNLTVRFYGRKKINTNTKFTIIGLPDTQFYTEEPQGNGGSGGHNGIFKAQTQWIADHRVDSSVAFVVQLGDCVQNGDNPPGADDEIEWRRADTSMKKIEFPNVSIAHGIPYGICVGNHDQGTVGSPDLPSNYYNQYFGESRFTGRSYYGGHYSTNNDNHFQLFSAGGVDFIHIAIEYYANGTTPSLQGVLDWADNLLKTYPNRKGIISSHNMLTTGNPANFQGPGQKIYDDLKDNPNLILMLAGHVAGEGRRTDVFSGNTVHTLMSDYQSGYTNGGNGYLRIMQFLPGQNLLSVKTYSPYSNTSLTGSGSQFSLPVNLTQPFALIGTNTNVASGSQTCINWPSLEAGAEYEWYVEITDANNNTTTGPIWNFAVPPNTVPVVGTDPLTQSICPGDAVSFVSAATGNPVPTVQWQVSLDNGANWSNILSATNSTLTFNTVSADNGKQYRAIWTNIAGADTSAAATLTITTYTITVTQTANGTITPGTTSPECHSNQTFTIVPVACYHITDVLVDAVSVGAVTSYTFSDLITNHTITATYAPTVISISNTTSVTNTICVGDNNGSINIVATGGTGSLMYSIDGGANYFASGLFTNLTGAVYAVRIKDAENCTKDTSISLVPIVAHWTGIIDNNWHNAANWSNNKIPDQYTHVVVEGGTPNNCHIINTDGNAASLRVKPTALFEVAANRTLIISAACAVLPPE